MPERMSGGLDHPRLHGADADPVAVAHGDVERRQAMGVAGGADDFHRRKALLQHAGALNVIGVMMREEEMGQCPAARRGLGRDRRAIRRVDARRGAARRIVDQQAKVVVQTDKLRHLDRHTPLR